jgi:hypothetical protein
VRLAAWALLLVAACSDKEPNAEKKIPKLAPPPAAPVPPALRITVEIDGAERPVLDAPRLESAPADFTDDQRRAWRLDHLVAPPRAGAWDWVVTGANEVTVVLPGPASDKDPVPVIMLSRRGEIVGTLVEPDRPFPQFHGEGGRRGRPGDPFPHVVGVTRIKVQPRN